MRQEGKLPAFGKLATPLGEPIISWNNDDSLQVPQLAFGCYKVPDNEQGESILKNAIRAGYRHFDTASFYGNEATLGRVLRQSGIPREKFFLVSKVWNDAQKQGRSAVRTSVEEGLNALDFGGYWDSYLVHWPVPGHYIDTYHELEALHKEGKIRSIGLSNFSIEEYEALVQDGISVPPAFNQFEVSPFMYRPKDVEYFQTRGNMLVAASKAMHRAGALTNEVVQSIATTHNVTPAQVMIRWGVEKKLIVLTMSSSLEHQQQNRDVAHISLSPEEIEKLDHLTSEEAITERGKLEEERKKSM